MLRLIPFLPLFVNQTAPVCTFNSWFGVIPCGTTGVITITLGQLAILGIGGFFVGMFITIGLTLYKWRYGIITIILREVGVTYRQVFQKMQKPDATSFKHKIGHPKKEIEYIIDLTRAIWLDSHNRPVLVYEQDTITALAEEHMNAKLKKAIEVQQRGLKLHLKKDYKRPAEPLAIFFGRKGAEMVIRAVTGQKGTAVQGIALAILFAVMAGVIGYFLGSAFPYTNYVHTTAPAVPNATTTSTTR